MFFYNSISSPHFNKLKNKKMPVWTKNPLKMICILTNIKGELEALFLYQGGWIGSNYTRIFPRLLKWTGSKPCLNQIKAKERIMRSVLVNFKFYFWFYHYITFHVNDECLMYKSYFNCVPISFLCKFCHCFCRSIVFICFTNLQFIFKL